MAINSTPLISRERIIELIALLPPPPTPTTLILAKVVFEGLTSPIGSYIAIIYIKLSQSN